MEHTAADPAASTERRCLAGLQTPSVRTAGHRAKGTGHGIRRGGVSLSSGTACFVSQNQFVQLKTTIKMTPKWSSLNMKNIDSIKNDGV